ncbi:MAG: disulfide reductase [Desulfobacterales bacterium CG07_land_8_20_14_0_80_52_14]|nr:MAG: disulfide reductase [Desulfobacterales bacterium CG23_combo_of_CG06-09_8_20_14_all_52_9]PIU50419.1 MAG: disulfide reductase [Desulfobacterales bacterium CG07_land_8_20_14_0_80_52_14]
MKFALFLGCNIPARVQQYELAARVVLAKLQVDLVDIREFTCCGYPMRNADLKTSLLFSARNLALAEQQGLNVLTLCQCCFGTLKKAAHLLEEDNRFKEEVNAFLAKEKLTYQGKAQVKHLLSLLHKDIGEAALKEKIRGGFKELKIAAHYGCHALRPSDVMQFDDPVSPSILDELIKLTGAQSVDWSQKLECCGAPLLGVNDDLSMKLTAGKLADAKASGARFLSVACPWCQLQFDGIQKQMEAEGRTDADLPSILYPQLLGLAMGISAKELGLSKNVKDISGVNAFLVQQ